MVVLSHSIEHPECPRTNEYVRVDTYISQMVIRAHDKLNEVRFTGSLQPNVPMSYGYLVGPPHMLWRPCGSPHMLWVPCGSPHMLWRPCWSPHMLWVPYGSPICYGYFEGPPYAMDTLWVPHMLWVL